MNDILHDVRVSLKDAHRDDPEYLELARSVARMISNNTSKTFCRHCLERESRLTEVTGESVVDCPVCDGAVIIPHENKGTEHYE